MRTGWPQLATARSVMQDRTRAVKLRESLEAPSSSTQAVGHCLTRPGMSADSKRSSALKNRARGFVGLRGAHNDIALIG